MKSDTEMTEEATQRLSTTGALLFLFLARARGKKQGPFSGNDISRKQNGHERQRLFN